jgi:hypothetical protein
MLCRDRGRPQNHPDPGSPGPIAVGTTSKRSSTAGCADIDPHTPCMHDRSSRVCEGIVCMHHAKRVKHTEIRCYGSLLLMDIEVNSLSTEQSLKQPL